LAVSIGILILSGWACVGAGSVGWVTDLAGGAVVGCGARAGLAGAITEGAGLPGAIVSGIADTGELDVGVCAVRVALLADSIDDEVSCPADTGVSVPGGIDALPHADTILHHVISDADALCSVEGGVDWTDLAEPVDNILVGSSTDASA
jgi:hypothetical protein